MHRQYKFAFLTLILSTFMCRPADDTYLRDVYLNYTEFGFLSTDVYQISCSYRHKTRYIEDSDPDWRIQLLQTCRNETIKALGSYKVHYEMDRKARLQGSAPVINNQYSIQWSDFQLEELKKLFNPFLPGHIVKESVNKGVTTAIYRLTHEDLINRVQDSEFPFEFAMPVR